MVTRYKALTPEDLCFSIVELLHWHVRLRGAIPFADVIDEAVRWNA